MSTTPSAATSSPLQQPATIGRLLAFFLPLGFSASLVTISHVIINSTLARATVNPEMVISSYAIALSVIAVTERPGILLRQTCSALVRDRVSFRAMSFVAMLVFLYMFLAGVVIAYTPIGRWLFSLAFGVSGQTLDAVIDVYRIIMYLSIFSGIRCLYQGIIIYNKRTAILTLGMGIRLVIMYALAQYFISTNQVTSGKIGAIIFLTGMVIESLISYLEGRSLLKKRIPEKLPEHPITERRQIFSFYRPLLYSSLIAVVIGPAINAFLGKTTNMELAIASYTIALSLANLVQSFFSYVHQIVLNFYKTDKATVIRFTYIIAFIPSILLGILSYTSVGPWFLRELMGVSESLMNASIDTLRLFMIMTFVFPWLDFCNGIIMLRGQTKIMVHSQSANVLTTIVLLVVLTVLSPGWNGKIGALSLSLGLCAELAVVLYALRALTKTADRLVRRE